MMTTDTFATEMPEEDTLFQFVHPEDHADVDEREYASYSYVRETVNRFLANKGAVVSLVVIAFIVLMAIFAPMASPYTYYDTNPSITNLPPRIPVLESVGICDGTQNGVNLYAQAGVSGEYHFFGTDGLGRDIWTRVWEGTRISLMIAFIAVIVGVLIGIVYGLISGYFGGKVDIVMQRFTEILNSIPQLVITTLLIVVLKPGLMNIVIVLFLTGWIDMSRIVRAQVLKYKTQEFTLAARTLGVSAKDIIFKEILPNTMPQVVVTFMFSIPNAIFLEAFLAFIGLGIPAPTASLGTMINDGYNAAMTYPYQVLAPVCVLAILMLGFNLFGDGLRDALDPERS